MFNLGDHFTLLALEGRAAQDGEVGAMYTVTAKRGAKYWMTRDDGERGVAAVPEAELADSAIWQPS